VRAGGRITTSLGPEKNDPRTVWRDVYRYFVIRTSRHTDEILSVGPSGDADTIAFQHLKVPEFPVIELLRAYL
jgi:hypothetical protein